MDLGASWIHGQTGNPLTKLARAASAPVVATRYTSAVLLDQDGAVIDPDLRPAETLLCRALRAADRLEQDISVLHAVEASPDWQRADADLRRLVMNLVNSTLEQEYGSPARLLSAWHGQDASEFGGEDVLFPGGFDQIPTHLARGLDISLKAEVAQIAPGQVRLADGSLIAADRMVCTLPLGVLQSGRLRFSDPLTPSRQAAIDRHGMGLLNKCWRRFDRVHWPYDVDWLGWMGPRTGFLGLMGVAGTGLARARAFGLQRRRSGNRSRRAKRPGHHSLRHRGPARHVRYPVSGPGGRPDHALGARPFRFGQLQFQRPGHQRHHTACAGRPGLGRAALGRGRGRICRLFRDSPWRGDVWTSGCARRVGARVTARVMPSGLLALTTRPRLLQKPPDQHHPRQPQCDDKTRPDARWAHAARMRQHPAQRQPQHPIGPE